MSEWYDNQKKPTSDWRKKIAADKLKQRKLTDKVEKYINKNAEIKLTRSEVSV
tara:strand:+ start:486 stop:644 length:159 start_codon:yes stop_codon:yes gene_type:complete